MTTTEYLKQAPKGTSRAQMAKIVQNNNGDKAKIEKAIKDLWNKFEDNNTWVEVAPKAKKKPVKQPQTGFKHKKTFNGQQNGFKKKNNWGSKPTSSKPVGEATQAQVTQSKPVPAANSWASKLFKPEAEKPKPVPQPPKKPPPLPKKEEEKKPVEKPKEKAVPVEELEAELFKETKQEEKKKPLVEKGVTFPKSFKKSKDLSIDVTGLGRVSFGASQKVSIDLNSLATDAGKELVPFGTLSKLKELERELQLSKDEVKRLTVLQSEVQAEISQAADKSRKYTRRIQELESAAQEKDNLREEVSKLTKQLEEHQLNQRQYYDRLKDESLKKEDEKKPLQPSGPVQTQQGYNMPPPTQVYQQVPYFHPHPQYYQGFPPPFAQPQSPGPPPSRYNYDSQPQPPPSHPPGTGPSQNASSGEHGHFSPHHEEFRGPLRRGMPSQGGRDIGLDKNPPHPPPGYGGSYGYPPNVNVMYQQQQPPFPGGQGQQKWSSGR